MQAGLAIALAAALCASGCGGDDVDCSFEACGGDVIGTWSFDDVCVDATGLIADVQEQCPDATVSVGGDASGTITFAEDGSYSTSLELSFSSLTTIPASCIPNATSCEDLNSDDTDCSGDIEQSCSCSGSSVESDSDSGNWSTSGTTLNLGLRQSEYCVSGETLKVDFAPGSPDDLDLLFILSRS